MTRITRKRKSVWRQLRLTASRHPRLILVAKFSVLFGLFYLISWRKLDPDFGWHLQAGDYIRAHGIPSHDIFTYTASNFPWINHEWGNDVLVSLLYGLGGYGLVAVLFSALWAAAILVASSRARLAVLLLAGLAITQNAGIRPIAWTALFFALTLRLLASKQRRYVWILPLLFIVWANLHAGFIIGLALILYMAVYERRVQLVGVFGLSVLASLINAYGPRLYIEIGRTIFDPRLNARIAEWQPYATKLSVSLIFIGLWGAGTILLRTHDLKQWFRPSMLLLLATLAARRNIPLFVIASTSELNQFWQRTKQAVPRHLNRAGKWWLGMWLAAACLLVAYVAIVQLKPLLRFDRDSGYPTVAVRYLQVHGCKGGHLLNDYNYGGYLIWKLPSQPVFIDGRMPSWKDEHGQQYLSVYYDVLSHPSQQAPTLLQRYHIRCVLLTKSTLNDDFINYLRANHWQTAVNEANYQLQVAPK